MAAKEDNKGAQVGTPTPQTERGGSSIWQHVSKVGILLVLSILWGLAFVAIRSAVTELSPVNLALIRWFLASAGFLVIVPFIGKHTTKFERGDLPRLLVIALLNAPVYHLSLNLAETTVSSGLAGLLSSLGPVFIAILSALFLSEKISSRLVLALFLGIAGAVILSLPNLDLSSAKSIVGPLEVALAMLSFAVFSVLSKPIVHKYSSVLVTIWAGLAGTLMLLPLLSWGFVSDVAELSLTGWFSVLYLSLLSTVVGYLLFYMLVSRGSVSKLSIQLYLIPVVSVVGGVLLLQESLSAHVIAGGAILLLSVALATMNRK